MLSAIDPSQKTFARIKLNYAFALDGGVNVILAIPVAIGVFFPWLGFAAATLGLLVQPSVAPPFSSALQVEMAMLSQGLESLQSWVQVVR